MANPTQVTTQMLIKTIFGGYVARTILASASSKVNLTKSNSKSCGQDCVRESSHFVFSVREGDQRLQYQMCHVWF